ncbi:MAG: hypothetical protein V1850_03795 [Candidatus Bathyarchaeota archaeon]
MLPLVHYPIVLPNPTSPLLSPKGTFFSSREASELVTSHDVPARAMAVDGVGTELGD